MKSTLTEVLTINKKQFETLKKLYDGLQRPSANPYILFSAKDKDLTVSVYAQDEGFKVVFQGNRAADESLLFKPSMTTFNAHIGSDEVGTGDFFGPIVVASAYVDKTTASTLHSLGVKDSKLLNDVIIRVLGKKLIKSVPYAINLLDNKTFNEWTSKKMNMNEVKAVLHHQVLSILVKKIKHQGSIVIDQFCDEKKFKEYLSHHDLTPLPHITFVQKAENKFLAVAAASIIARYRFLLAMDELKELHDISFPFGASIAVEKFALGYAKKHGITQLASLVKTNFSTFTRIKKALS